MYSTSQTVYLPKDPKQSRLPKRELSFLIGKQNNDRFSLWHDPGQPWDVQFQPRNLMYQRDRIKRYYLQHLEICINNRSTTE